ncbi:unnamed protein product [Rotaria sp. Silwood1]|nr:unnamed protein product [Rotaria sp. Silwood1]
MIWNRQLNDSCTSLFHISNSSESIRYTCNTLNCTYIDDEEPHEILSNTRYEDKLVKFDKSLINIEQQSIVFLWKFINTFLVNINNRFFDIKINVINQDFGGSTLKQCMQRFKRIILPLEPRLLLLYAGENDITNNQTPTNIQFILTIRRFFFHYYRLFIFQ